jgi:hypothetical protein
MPASQELLIDRFVTAPAIASCELYRDHETVMVFFFLTLPGLMAFEAVNALACVRAHLVLVDDGILRALMTLRAFARGTYKFRTRLFRLYSRTRPVQKECCYDERESDYHGNEDGAEWHAASRFQKDEIAASGRDVAQIVVETSACRRFRLSVVGEPQSYHGSDSHCDENSAQHDRDAKQNAFEAIQFPVGGGHKSSSLRLSMRLGADPISEPDHISGRIPYWRL